MLRRTCGLELRFGSSGIRSSPTPLCGSLDRKITLLWIECSEGALRGPLDRNVLLRTIPTCLGAPADWNFALDRVEFDQVRRLSAVLLIEKSHCFGSSAPRARSAVLLIE